MGALTFAKAITIGKTGTTCVSCGDIVNFEHRIPLDPVEGLLEDFGACECGQVYRIVTGVKNGKVNVRSDPISRRDVTSAFNEDVVVRPGRKVAYEDA
jgi:hypothetical protein